MIARSAWLPVTITVLALTFASRAEGQSSALEKLKAMSGDPDTVEGKAKKDKDRPPFEFYASRVAPFDVLPYAKKHHWLTLTLEMQANLGGYEGFIQTTPEVGGKSQISLYAMPHAMIYRREALLQKEQRARLGLQMMLPDFGKELSMELSHPDSIRPDGFWSAPLMRLEPHQMVIPVFAPEPSLYASWSRMQATIPTSGDRDSASIEIEKQRYYRLSLFQAERPGLSTNPLTWTSVSHLVWDGFSPDMFSTGQQQAMLDWIHLGGQLIVVAAGPTAVAPLEKSFLKDYLPATDSGGSVRLTEKDLVTLSRAYPPPLWPSEVDELLDVPGIRQGVMQTVPGRYKPYEPIRPAPEKPLFVAGLAPKPGATAIPIGDPGNTPLAVEWRVGRGRVIMLAVNPNDPSLAAWPGMDSLVRRVLLRRVEEVQGTSTDKRIYDFLGAPNLTWFRLLGRDLGAQPTAEIDPEPNSPLKADPVAAWLDTKSEMPVMSRDVLEEASGITIPPASFVLKVIIAYVLVLVPVNYLLCRYILRRRELAWAFVPILSLGFAVGVERAAAYDMGFDSDCTEIDLIEMQAGYPRAHLNRFAALYSTGRDKYTISYPKDPSALILPLNTQRALRGEESSTSIFESFPEPALKGFQVQPRSLSMFRAEAIVEVAGVSADLPTGITLGGPGGDSIINNTTLDLHDAVLVDVDTFHVSDEGTTTGITPLGIIGAGETVKIGGPSAGTKAKPANIDWTDPAPFLQKLLAQKYSTPEEAGERRLVAWTPGPHGLSPQRLPPGGCASQVRPSAVAVRARIL